MADGAGADQPASHFDSSYHAPVLVHAVVELLAQSGAVLDGTLGGGGHAAALLDAGVPQVFGIDRDGDALSAATLRLREAAADGRFACYRGNHGDIDAIRELDGVTFDGVLLDLGISSHQIDETARGFSFRESAPLDMRMGFDAPRTAANLLNESGEAELVRVFREYGDEPHAGRLAREVVRRRLNRPFATSDDFVGAIRGALGARSGAGEFARLFQSLRIAVNDEIAGLERSLASLHDRLRPGGTLVLIAYHSGEDRLVKQTFRRWSEACVCPPRLPMCACGGTHASGATLTRRAVVADAAEVARNPRARSARLRAWRRAA